MLSALRCYGVVKVLKLFISALFPKEDFGKRTEAESVNGVYANTISNFRTRTQGVCHQPF